MKTERRAVIDIGTNSVKLLVAAVEGAEVRWVHKAGEAVRLGQGIFETHWLQPDAIQRAAQVVARLARQAAGFNPSVFHVIATSAVREAVNRADLVNAVEAASGLKVEVLSGEQEAEWVFAGVRRDPALAGLPLMVIDVGGGSTEFIIGQDDLIICRYSFPLGSLRLLERLPPSDPPAPGDLSRCRAWLAHFLYQEVWPRLEPRIQTFGRHRVRLVGTGAKLRLLAELTAGPATTGQTGASLSLNLEQLHAALERLWRLTRAERQQLHVIPAARADLVLTVGAIVEGIMQLFDFPELHSSDWGLSHGAILAPFKAQTVGSSVDRQAFPAAPSAAGPPRQRNPNHNYGTIMKPKEIIKKARKFAEPFRVTDGKNFRLKDIDPGELLGFNTEDKPRAKEALAMGMEALAELQDKLYAQDKWALLLIFQAMDAAGKDGAIKHVMSGVNPQGCQVYSFKSPSAEDLDHDYLWRCMKCCPTAATSASSTAVTTRKPSSCACIPNF